MECKNPEQRNTVLIGMKEILRGLVGDYEQELHDRLAPEEQLIYDTITDARFKGQQYYRPMHNFDVIGSGLVMCYREDLDRRVLMPAFGYHDIGNAFMDVDELEDSGASWEDTDKRISHANLSADKAVELLWSLRLNDMITVGDDTIFKVDEIIRGHDGPYTGIPIFNEQARQLRDADRVYVPSWSSYPKDLIAYMNDDRYKHLQGLSEEEIQETFLKQRLAFFYPTALENPLQAVLPLEPELAQYNEGGRCEPMYTDTAKSIVDHIFVQRFDEYRGEVWKETPEKFLEFFEKRLAEEGDWMLRLIDESKDLAYKCLTVR